MKRVLTAGLAFFCTVLPITASAGADAKPGGTFFMLEVDTGLRLPSHAGSGPGLAYGVAAGLTWKFRALPLRFHLLTHLQGGKEGFEGLYADVPYTISRRELDLRLSFRTAIPILKPLRLYAEIGSGERWAWESVRRGAGLGSLSSSSADEVWVWAVGCTARIHRNLSVGLRLQGSDGPDSHFLRAIAGLEESETRMTGLAQMGFHF
jgi:hypothetical protein